MGRFIIYLALRSDLTIYTGGPRLLSELVILEAGEGEVPLVEVVLKPVPGVASITDVHHSLTVGRGIVGVPYQLQVVFPLRCWGIYTVGPCQEYQSERVTWIYSEIFKNIRKYSYIHRGQGWKIETKSC